MYLTDILIVGLKSWTKHCTNIFFLYLAKDMNRKKKETYHLHQDQENRIFFNTKTNQQTTELLTSNRTLVIQFLMLVLACFKLEETYNRVFFKHWKFHKSEKCSGDRFIAFPMMIMAMVKKKDSMYLKREKSFSRWGFAVVGKGKQSAEDSPRGRSVRGVGNGNRSTSTRSVS